MNNNEIVQWSVVAVIILVAILWILIKIIRSATGKRSGCDCGICSETDNCKLKEVKDELKKKH